MDRETLVHYSTPTRILHWVTAVLVLVAFIYGPGGSEARVYSAARDFDRQLHETLGLCVLALVVLRLGWRSFDKRPEPPPVARWMSLSAGVVQAALYVLLIAVPLTAIAGAWLEGHALTLLGGVTVAPVVAKSHALGATIAQVHTWLGDAILWLAGAHAAAGLFHHYVLKDGVLRSMLARRSY
jgi:cytochrome b561